MNRNEERREMSKKILTALLSADDGSPVSDMPTFQKNLAKLCVGYADALLDELDKTERRTLEMKTETTSGCAAFEEFAKPPFTAVQAQTIPVATGKVQVGDLVMVSEGHRWVGPFLLHGIDDDPTFPFLVGNVNAPVGWRQARHLTDEERAKIKRI